MSIEGQTGLLPDTKPAEDPIEDVVGVNRSADLAEGIEGSAQLDREQLVAEVLLGGTLGSDETVDAAIQRITRTGGGRGEPLPPMGRLSSEALDDLGLESGDAFAGESGDAVSRRAIGRQPNGTYFRIFTAPGKLGTGFAPGQ